MVRQSFAREADKMRSCFIDGYFDDIERTPQQQKAYMERKRAYAILFPHLVGKSDNFFPFSFQPTIGRCMDVNDREVL